MPQQERSFKNSRGRVITTRDAVTAEKYAYDPGFTEVTEGAPNASAYADMNKAALKDEVAKRNTGRDEATQIVVGGAGNKPDLIAALENDDTASTTVDD